MSTPPNQPQKDQPESAASDPSPDQPAPESPEEEEDEGECGFCLFMKGGGCKDTFVAWEDCVKEAEEKKEDLVEKCSQVTGLLKQCMDAHSDYYEPILRAEKHAEEQVVIELEREKQDSTPSNNEQEAPNNTEQEAPNNNEQEAPIHNEPEALDPSTEQPASESPEAKDEEEEEEEGECGFCLFMKGGGCKDTFVNWENCVKEAEEKKEDLVEKCSQVTDLLKQCMDAHSDYYEPILRAEKHVEEQAVIELEKEKQDSAHSKNEQEDPSHSNQN